MRFIGFSFDAEDDPLLAVLANRTERSAPIGPASTATSTSLSSKRFTQSRTASGLDAIRAR
jgi:hypothetical protein